MIMNYPTVKTIDQEAWSLLKNPTLMVLKMIASPKNLSRLKIVVEEVLADFDMLYHAKFLYITALTTRAATPDAPTTSPK